MRILYLAHRIPYPPDKGDKIRSFHQVRYLAARHEVWCACFVDDPRDARHIDALANFCRRVEAHRLPKWRGATRGIRRLIAGGSLSVGYYHDRRMRDTIRSWCRLTRFDAAVVFSSGMGDYRDVIRARRNVLDLCDWDSLKWRELAQRTRLPRSAIFALEARRLAKFELDCVRRFDACTVVTAAEAEAVRGANVHIVGNGVTPNEDEPVSQTSAPRVGFVGQMDYWPNVDAVRWFADRVWPAVRQRVPDATLEIVGRSPSREVQSLSQRSDRGIRVTGEVPDVRPYLRSFDVSVAPLRVGRGVQNKVLEAMAAAKPVVLTSAAAAGIDATDGEHFIVADDASIAAERIVSLLQSPGQRARLGQAARQRVHTRYSWDREMAKLEALLFD